MFERLQRQDQSGGPPMREELDSLLIGVIVAFMFGYFGPVRPGAFISLCHPGYQANARCWLCLVGTHVIKNYHAPIFHP